MLHRRKGFNKHGRGTESDAFSHFGRRLHPLTRPATQLSGKPSLETVDIFVIFL